MQVTTAPEITDPPWARKHVRSIRQAYARAPFLWKYLPPLEELLQRKGERLVDLDMACTALMAEWFGPRRRVERASALKIGGNRSDRLVNICGSLGASKYVSGDAARGYLDVALFKEHGIRSNGSGACTRRTRSCTLSSCRTSRHWICSSIVETRYH